MYGKILTLYFVWPLSYSQKSLCVSSYWFFRISLMHLCFSNKCCWNCLNAIEFSISKVNVFANEFKMILIPMSAPNCRKWSISFIIWNSKAYVGQIWKRSFTRFWSSSKLVSFHNFIQNSYCLIDANKWCNFLTSKYAVSVSLWSLLLKICSNERFMFLHSLFAKRFRLNL